MPRRSRFGLCFGFSRLHEHARIIGWVCAFVAMSAAGSASAQLRDHAFRVEVGGALPVGSTADRFDLGGAVGFSYEYLALRALGIELGYRGAFFPVEDQGGHGSYHGLGLGLRAHFLPSSETVDLYAAFGPDFVRTGDLNRFGLSGRVGADFLVGERLRVGPFVGYHHVFQSNATSGGLDASFLTVGVSVGLGGRAPREAARSDDGDGATRDDDGDGAARDDDGDGAAEASEGPDAEAYRDEEPDDECGAEPLAAHCPEGDRDGDPGRDVEEPLAAGAESQDGRDGYADADADASPAAGELLEYVVLFSRSRAEPTAEGQQELSRLARYLIEHPELEVRIEGHADATGAHDLNLHLSQTRARQVREALVGRYGIERSRLETQGFGDEQPARSGSDEESHRLNRRVVIRVLGENR